MNSFQNYLFFYNGINSYWEYNVLLIFAHHLEDILINIHQNEELNADFLVGKCLTIFSHFILFAFFSCIYTVFYS